MQFGLQGLGGVAAVAGAAVGALNGILNRADDAAAGGGAVPGRVRDGMDGVGQAAREQDAAADGAGDAVEGQRETDQGLERRGRRRVCGRRCALGRLGGWGHSLLRGVSSDLGVQEVSEVGAHGDQVVQDLPVTLCVRIVRAGDVRAGVVVSLGRNCVCRHERNKNIVEAPRQGRRVKAGINRFVLGRG